MAKQKILHIIVGLNDGGAEAVLYRLCAGDAQCTHVVISMMDEGKYGPLLQRAGVQVHCLQMPRGRMTFKGVLHLYRLIRSHRPDVVQTWMYHADLMGGVMAKLLGIKRVCWGLHHANLAADAVKGLTGLIARLCGFLSYYIPNAIVSCSHEAVRVHKEFAGYDSQKFIVIPNGVDLTNFTPDLAARYRVRETMSVQSDDFVVGMVARFDPQKDHANLLAAVGLLKKQGQYLHCVLVGTGMDSSNQALMRILIKEDVLDRVILLGRRDDIPALMNAMDVHALSSYSEALPNVLMEAMACGTLCISTSVGDAPMIVGENGWVVPSRNPEAFAKNLLAAKQMYETQPLEWQAKQIYARQRMLENFSIKQMRTAYAAAWKA